MIFGVSNSNTVAAAYWNSIDWQIVHEWNLEDGKIARFLRFGDKFMSESVVSAKVTREPFELPEGADYLSPDEIIADISERQPYINEDGTVDFLITAKGQLNDVTITERLWGVTLVDLGQSQIEVRGINPLNQPSMLSWGGHAVIVIETIEGDGLYHMKRADIVGDSNNQNVAKIRYKEIFPSDHLNHFDVLRLKSDRNGNPLPSLQENFPRSKTWIRPFENVLRMIRQIEKQREKFEAGTPVIFFNPYGGAGSKDTFNCIQWAKKQIAFADIRASNAGTIFIPIPSDHIQPGHGAAIREGFTTFGLTGIFWGTLGAGIGFFVGGPPGAAMGVTGGIGLGGLSGFNAFLCRSALNCMPTNQDCDRFTSYSADVVRMENEGLLE